MTNNTTADWHAGGAPPLAPSGPVKAFLLAVHLRDLRSTGDALVWPGAAGGPAVRLSVDALVLAVDLSTDAHPAPLRLSVPVAAVGGDEPHAVVVRYVGHRVELHVDGVLVDEEWPYGSMASAGGPIVVNEAVGRMTLFDGPISDAELRALAKGPADATDRTLGPPVPLGQYWRPRGFNVHVGDCMPFFHGGRFHLFYLFDRRNHASKWWRGAHQWAHASTADLVRWDHHELAVAITDEAEGSICTGSVFFRAGTYHAFYAVRTNDASAAQLCAATSTDGVRFAKHPPLATLGPPYRPGPGRDPVVFDDGAGLFHMLVSTELAEPPVPGRGGCLAELVSTDLARWEQRGPFLVPGYPDVPECPDHFAWRGWHYLLFSNGAVARYRMSRSPLGPWSRPAVDTFDGPELRVMKTAAFTGDRRIGAGFVQAGDRYGGDVVFRELVQHADGTLGTTWPAEMVPAAGDVLPWAARPLTGNATCGGRTVTLPASAGFAAAAIGPLPADFLLRCRVVPAAGAASVGIRLRACGDLIGGLDLRFDLRRGKVGFRPADLRPSIEHESAAIYDVAGLDREFNVELLAKGRLLDLCVDGRRTLIASIDPTGGHEAFVFSQDAGVTVEDVQVRPLI